MIVDATAAARRADPNRTLEWLADQRVFISSAIGDTTLERRAVAEVVEDMGARAVWFEEFGRDADAEEAYLTEVDASTVYIGILNEVYGRPNPPDGDSATEMEYRRAREGGKRLSVYVAETARQREGALSRFIERVRFYVTTESFTDTTDLARRVLRRLLVGRVGDRQPPSRCCVNPLNSRISEAATVRIDGSTKPRSGILGCAPSSSSLSRRRGR